MSHALSRGPVKQGGLAQSVASSHGNLKIAGSNPFRVDSALRPKFGGYNDEHTGGSDKTGILSGASSDQK